MKTVLESLCHTLRHMMVVFDLSYFVLCIHSLCRPHALREVVNHLYAMGLRNPSEPTYGVLSCLIGYEQLQSMEVSKFQEYLSFHQSMKSQAQDTLDRLRKLESTTDSIPPGSPIVLK